MMAVVFAKLLLLQPIMEVRRVYGEREVVASRVGAVHPKMSSLHPLLADQLLKSTPDHVSLLIVTLVVLLSLGLDR